MMVENSEDYIMLSGIQHFEFCQRQWALIHIEQQWNENKLTFEGSIIHDRVDDPFIVESSAERFVSRSVPVVSHRLKLYGIADVVEFIKSPSNGAAILGHEGLWKPYPIEYKHGKPKEDDCDILQLCAQAICLEEMLNIPISEGAMYYHKTRRRQKIKFDETIRNKTIETAKKMYSFFSAGITPAAVYVKKCDNCSMFDICLPKMNYKPGSVEKYIKNNLIE